MSVPGGNLLLDALDLIASQLVQYLAPGARVTTPSGIVQPGFAAPVDVPIGSVQAVHKDRYQFLGLDLQKQYVAWFVPQSVIGTQRASSGGRIIYAGKTWQLESDVNWFSQDGWVEVICVEIGPDA